MANKTLTQWMARPSKPFYKQPWYWGVVGVGAFLLFRPKKAQASALLASGGATPQELELSRHAKVPIALLRAIAAKESTATAPPAAGWPAGKGAAKIHKWGGPKVMRFEPHVFNRKVAASKHMPSSRGDKASRTESEVRVSAFREAFRRDPRAAVESTSWGRYQVMGSNFLKPLYNNDTNVFLNAWIDADYNQIEKMGDAYFAEWFRARPNVQEYANMPMDKMVRYGGKDRRVVDVIARKYNGAYTYGADKRNDDGSITLGLMSTYRNAVAKGAPTAVI